MLSFFNQRQRNKWLLRIIVLTSLLVTQFTPQFVSLAAPSLTVTPITWNVMGLDSNNVNVGPNNFPIGVRVCNNGTTLLNNVAAAFVWDTSDPYINLRAGSLNPITLTSLAMGACSDFYFEVTITRNAAAYDHTRDYHINITSTEIGTPVSTPAAREIYVEHLVSQSRNNTTDVQLDGNSIAAGGSMTLLVGETYDIKLIGSTATNGYEQVETFINFPNTIFQVLGVQTTYTADTSPNLSSPDDKLYANGCTWENDTNSPNYRSCLGVGKAGGNITVTYQVKIIGGAGTAQALSTLIYDFSGSSYHYNADFGTSTRIANIIDPASITIAKNFNPDPTSVGGISTLTFTISNPTTGVITGMNFSDVLPTTPGAMVVANPPSASTSNCGSPTFAPVAGAASLSFSNGTLAANSTCKVNVNVTVPVTGTYTNTSNHLFMDTLDTGNFATDPLTVNNAPAAPSPTCGLGLASWDFPSGFSLTSPVPTTSNVTSSASPGAGIISVDSTQNNSGGTHSWGSNGGIATGATLTTSNNDYFEFAVNTTGYSSVTLTFAARRTNNGPQSLAVYYGTSASPPGTLGFNMPGFLSAQNTWFASSTFGTLTFNSGLNPSGLTYFRIFAFNASNSVSGSDIYLDDVTLTGCATPNPPTITKGFSPNPIATNGVSVLTFTLANANSVNLTGVAFSDALPSGLQVANPTGYTTSCGFSATTPTIGATSLSFSGGTITANSSCTVSVNITGASAGSYQNVSGFVSSTNGGTNTGSMGSASASLTIIKPPSIAKLFAPNPILAGGISTLTFTITNPNLNNALSGVAFSDIFPTSPAAMVVASTPGALTTNCGSPTFSPVAGAASISFSNGTVAAGGSCTVKVNITAPSAGSYANTSGAVSSTNAGTGNTASDTLTVNSPSPSIAVLKQVGLSATGPWSSFLPVSTGANIYYQFTVENTGDVQLTSVAISDPSLPSAATTCNSTWTNPLPVAVAANENHIDSCVVGPIVAVSGVHSNTVTVNGTYNVTTVSDTSTANYATTGLTIAKSVTETVFNVAGDVLHYSFLVTNSGSASLLGPVVISDDKATDESCPAVNTVGDLDNYLDPGESITCTATYTILASDVTTGFVTNAAFATIEGVTSNTDTKTVYLTGFSTTTPTATVTATATATATSTATETTTPTGTATQTVTSTPTGTSTPTVTATVTSTTTETSTPTVTSTATQTETSTPTMTATVTETETSTPTVTATTTETGTPTPTTTVTETSTPTVTVTATETETPTSTVTVTATTTETGTPTPTTTATETSTPTVTVTATETETPTSTATVTTTATETGTPTATVTATETATPTVTVTQTATSTTTPTGTFTATPTATITATRTSTPTVTATLIPGIGVTKDLISVTFNNPNQVRLTYEITVANTGLVPLTNVQVTDNLIAAFPGAVSFNIVSLTSASLNINPGYNGNSDINMLTGTDTMGTGAISTVTLVVDVDTGGDEDNYLNTATASGQPPAGPPVQDSDQAPAPGFVDPALSKAGSPTQASVGETIVFTITVRNRGNLPAPNVVVTDTLMSMFDVTAVTVNSTVGTSTFTTTVTPAIGTGPAPYTVQVAFNGNLGVSEVVTIQVVTVVNSLGAPPVSNTAGLTTTALTDNVTNNSSTVNITLGVSQSASSLPATGFEPGEVTSLLKQPEENTYRATDLWLEIPSLGIKSMEIVGVPLTNKTWDVTWLDKKAGWLNGTSFPTWEGNSVITGHVYLSNGKPGPFVDLGKLKYGDKVLVHAYGAVYVYEIRENKIVKPDDKSAFKHEEKSWITLITCKTYNESTKTYSSRIVVRAVLLRIEEDSKK